MQTATCQRQNSEMLIGIIIAIDPLTSSTLRRTLAIIPDRKSENENNYCINCQSPVVMKLAGKACNTQRKNGTRNNAIIRME